MFQTAFNENQIVGPVGRGGLPCVVPAFRGLPAPGDLPTPRGSVPRIGLRAGMVGAAGGIVAGKALPGGSSAVCEQCSSRLLHYRGHYEPCSTAGCPKAHTSAAPGGRGPQGPDSVRLGLEGLREQLPL